MFTWVSAGLHVTHQIQENTDFFLVLSFISNVCFFRCKYFEYVSLCYRKSYYFAERKFQDFCALLYWYNIFRSDDDDVGTIDPGEPAHQIKLFSFRPRCPQRYLSTTISWKLAFHIFTKTSNLPIL